MLNRTKW